VPPSESRGEVHPANLRRLAERQFLHHAVDVECPDSEVLLALVQNGVVRQSKSGLAILADEALTPVAVSVLEDVDGAAMRTDDGLLGREEGVEGGNRDAGDLGGGGVDPSKEVLLLLGGCRGEELTENFKLGGSEHFWGSLLPLYPRVRRFSTLF